MAAWAAWDIFSDDGGHVGDVLLEEDFTWLGEGKLKHIKMIRVHALKQRAKLCEPCNLIAAIKVLFSNLSLETTQEFLVESVWRLSDEEKVDPPHRAVIDADDIAELREAEEEEEEAADAPVCIFERVVHEFTTLCKAAHPKVPWASHKSLVKYLGAVAEASLRAQDVNLQNLLKYINALQGADALAGVLLLAHVSFDETPLKLSVSFDNNRSVEMSRVIAVETSWSVLVHDRQHVPSDAAAAYTIYT
eukprot:6466819-Amphidinium_carterae.1